MSAILKIVKSPYLNKKNQERWYKIAHLELDDSHVTKYEHFYRIARQYTDARY